MGDNLQGNAGDPKAGQAGNPQTPDWNVLIDPATGKIAGKWATPEEAKQGYWNIVEQNRLVQAENTALKERLTTEGRGDPAARAAARKDPLEELKNWGVPTDPIDQLVEERSEAAAKRYFEPILQMINARSQMVEEFPDYGQQEGKVMQYVRSNPVLSEVFNSIARQNPYGGLRFGWAMFKESSAAAARTQDAETQAARAAAALPGSAGSGISRSAVENKSGDLEKALQEALATRSPEAQAAFFSNWLEGRPLLWGEKPGQ